MFGTLNNGGRWIAAAGVLATALLLLVAGSANAAIYPAGPSTFTGGAEGWKATGTCTLPLNLPLVCASKGGYDGTAGNPAGSLADNSEILINAGGLFATTLTAESPEFKAVDGGAGTLHVDRQFDPGLVLHLGPTVAYTVALVDKTAGTEQKAISETITAESAFAGREGAVSLVDGHSYAIKISADTTTTVAGIGLLGTITTRFDNVSVTGPGNNGNGNNGANGNDGSNGLSNSQLTTLMQNSLISPAILKGKRLFVKAKCPAKVGTACRVSVQGLIKKGKPATTTRTVKIPKGKTKQLVLEVKPASRSKVAAKRKLLFKETVKAGSAKATVYKRLKLIKRG